MTGDEVPLLDNESVIWARAVVMDRRRNGYDKVVAYRILAKTFPQSYRPQLVRALLDLVHRQSVWERSAWYLSLLEEAVEVARSIDAAEPRRAKVLEHALGSYRFDLYVMGRRAEAFAVSEELGALGVIEKWADSLAEEGHHSQAADLYGQLAERRRPQGAAGGGAAWGLIEWAAELEAAGRDDEALAAFTELVAMEREEALADRSPLRCLVYVLVAYSRMWHARGRREESALALAEAAQVARELAATGERKSWSGYQVTFLVTLLGFSAGRQERAAWGLPCPRFGSSMMNWSPDLRLRYCESLAELRQANEAAGSAERAELSRRLAVRSAIVQDFRHGLYMHEVRPAFDDSVRAGRAMGDKETLLEALLDRSTFLMAIGGYAEGLIDLEEVMASRSADPSGP